MKYTPPGALISTTIHTPGSGYAAGQILGVASGSNGKIQILSVIASAPFAIKVYNSGKGYLDATNVPATGGTGTGLTLDIAATNAVGLAPPPGSGSIQQKTNSGETIRQRTIQKTFPGNQHYLGSLLRSSPEANLFSYNKRKLHSLAAYWERQLSGGDRLAWDAAAPLGLNGFDYFMRLNLTGYAINNATLPVLGQNIGDVTSPAAWVFTPCLPLVVAGWHTPTKTSLVLTFTGRDLFSLTDLTGSASVTSRAEHITVYSTRPFTSNQPDAMNPLVRLGRFVASASGAVSFFLDPNDSTSAPLKTLWERVIGGAVTGQKLHYGYRFNSVQTPVGISGALHVATTTVL